LQVLLAVDAFVDIARSSAFIDRVAEYRPNIDRAVVPRFAGLLSSARWLRAMRSMFADFFGPPPQRLASAATFVRKPRALLEQPKAAQYVPIKMTA